MEVIKEEFYQINLWCRPLGRTLYRFEDIKQGKVKNVGKATGTLYAELNEARAKASGILVKDPSGVLIPQNNDADILTLTPEQIEIREARERIENMGVDTSTLPRFKRLKVKLDNKIFDYSEIETEQIEEEINKIINKDHYYDEIEPMDADVEYKEERTFSPLIFGLFGAFVLLLALLVFVIRG